MIYTVEFIVTRKNESKPVWYENSDFKNILEKSDNILKNLGEGFISKDYTYSSNNLIYTRRLVFKEKSVFFQYLSLLNMEIPDIMVIRNNYFLENEHSLILKWETENDHQSDGFYVIVP